MDVTGSQRHAEHLPCRFRQFMGLIYDDDAMLWENGSFALTAVDGVRQQKIMVTDLEHISIRVAVFQKALVPAVLMIAVAELRNTDTFPVITAEVGGIVHVQRSFQRAKGVGGCRIFLLKVHLTKSPLQAFVANIMAFAFADHREQWAVNLSVCQQGAGQQRKVFRLHGVLQGDAGS